jgi:imidazolonepropionase-like amidohydrolase
VALAAVLHEEGMPPADQNRAMTLSAAELGWQYCFGSLEAKKFAGPIAVAGNELRERPIAYFQSLRVLL